MTIRWAWGLCCIALCSPAGATDFSRYRGFELGSKVAVARLQPGTRAVTRVVQQRPGVIEELDWRPPYHFETSPPAPDPVGEILLRFFNQKLFQIVVTYDRLRIQGMTESDLMEGISGTYGQAANPKTQIAFQSNYGESALVLAQWGNEEYVYSLIRTADGSSFALVATMARLETQARQSMVEARRLDVLEAPQKEADLKAKQANDQQVLLEQARGTNITLFHP